VKVMLRKILVQVDLGVVELQMIVLGLARAGQCEHLTAACRARLK